MFFYLFNKDKTIYELRKASSYTLEELSKRSGIPSSELQPFEYSKLKDVPKELRRMLVEIFENQIGVI